MQVFGCQKGFLTQIYLGLFFPCILPTVINIKTSLAYLFLHEQIPTKSTAWPPFLYRSDHATSEAASWYSCPCFRASLYLQIGPQSSSRYFPLNHRGDDSLTRISAATLQTFILGRGLSLGCMSLYPFQNHATADIMRTMLSQTA